MFEHHGGKVWLGLQKNDCLLAGESTGFKLDKANELDAQVLDELVLREA